MADFPREDYGKDLCLLHSKNLREIFIMGRHLLALIFIAVFCVSLVSRADALVYFNDGWDLANSGDIAEYSIGSFGNVTWEISWLSSFNGSTGVMKLNSTSAGIYINTLFSVTPHGNDSVMFTIPAHATMFAQVKYQINNVTGINETYGVAPYFGILNMSSYPIATKNLSLTSNGWNTQTVFYHFNQTTQVYVDFKIPDWWYFTVGKTVYIDYMKVGYVDLDGSSVASPTDYQMRQYCANSVGQMSQEQCEMSGYVNYNNTSVPFYSTVYYLGDQAFPCGVYWYTYDNMTYNYSVRLPYYDGCPYDHVGYYQDCQYTYAVDAGYSCGNPSCTASYGGGECFFLGSNYVHECVMKVGSDHVLPKTKKCQVIRFLNDTLYGTGLLMNSGMNVNNTGDYQFSVGGTITSNTLWNTDHDVLWQPFNKTAYSLFGDGVFVSSLVTNAPALSGYPWFVLSSNGYYYFDNNPVNASEGGGSPSCSAGWYCEGNHEYYLTSECVAMNNATCGGCGCGGSRCSDSNEGWYCQNEFESWHRNSTCQVDIMLLCDPSCDFDTGQCAGEVNCVHDYECIPYCSGLTAYNSGVCNLDTFTCVYTPEVCSDTCSNGHCIIPITPLFGEDTSPLGAIGVITSGLLSFLNVTGVPLFNIIFWIFVAFVIISVFSLMAYLIKHGFG